MLAIVALWAPWRKPQSRQAGGEIASAERTIMLGIRRFADSRRCLYIGKLMARGGLWVRSLDSVEARRIADTQTGPPLFIWSADSRFIAFPDGEQLNKLIKVDLVGGSPQTICEMHTIAGPDPGPLVSSSFGDLSGV